MKAFVGALFWILALGSVATVIAAAPDETRDRLRHVQSELWQAVRVAPPAVEVVFPGGTVLRRGDGVFRLLEHRMQRVGEVARMQGEGADLRVWLQLDPGQGLVALTADTRVVRRSQGQSLLYAVRTLLPPERLRLIQQDWDLFLRRYQREMMRQLRPLVPRLTREFTGLVLEELELALERRSPEIQALLARYRSELASDQAVPLLVDEIWPMFVEHAKGPAETIGRILWDRMPLFQLAWRAAYDHLVEDEPVHVEKRWNAFVRDEAIPVLREHGDLLRGAASEFLKEVATSEEVRRRLGTMTLHLLQDPELRELLAGVLRDLLVDNERLEAWIEQQAADPDVRRRLAAVNSRLQQFFDVLGNRILLDELGEGIHPDLARLLRVLLMKRDRNYLFLEVGEGPPLADGQVLVGLQES